MITALASPVATATAATSFCAASAVGARIPLSGLDYCRSSGADRRGLQPAARAPSLAGVTVTLALVPFRSP
jgi:hypothetical protein